MTDNNTPKKGPGWFERWLGRDDVFDQDITPDDAEKSDGGDDRG